MPKRQKAQDVHVPDPTVDESKEYTVLDTAYSSIGGHLAHTSTQFNLPRSPVKKAQRANDPSPNNYSSFTVSEDVDPFVDAEDVTATSHRRAPPPNEPTKVCPYASPPMHAHYSPRDRTRFCSLGTSSTRSSRRCCDTTHLEAAGLAPTPDVRLALAPPGTLHIVVWSAQR